MAFWRISLGMPMCVVLATISASPVGAQDDVELRALIKLLERRLGEPERPAAPRSGERVTEIGASTRRPVVVEEEEKEVVRIYDLSDLFTIAPPYIARQSSDLRPHPIAAVRADQAMFPVPGAAPLSSGGGLGGGLSGIGGGAFNLPASDGGKAIPRGALPQVGGFGIGPDVEGNFGGSRISFDDLIDAITSTIEPAEWEGVGGPGSIQPLGNALIIRATPSIHQQVDNLLGLLRKKWGTLRTISIEAWWLWLGEPAADALISEARAKGEHAEVFGAVDNAEFAKRVSEIAAAEDGRPGYRAKITCYNGQTVHTVSGGQQLYVTDVVPVIEGESIAYRPVVSLVQEGAALQVRPHATQKGKYAALDIHTRVNLLAEAPVAEEAEAPGERGAGALAAAGAIDRPRLSNARLSTSLRLPIDQVMLVAAMSFDGHPAAGSENLYLFVKLSLQELRDDREGEAVGEGIEPS